MALLFFCVLYNIFLVLEIRAISLNGHATTRYDPCDLGVVHFDKDMRNASFVWSGVVDFTLYPNITKAEVEIVFQVPLESAWETQKCNLLLNDDLQSIKIRMKEGTPKKCTFFIEMANDVVPTVKSFTMNSEVLCSEHEKEVYSEQLFHSTTDKETEHVCGRRSLDHGEVVSVGGVAKAGEWPWHVAIFLKADDDSSEDWYRCGGSIIAKDTVLTAAHCVVIKGVTSEADQVIVVAGTNDIGNLNEPGLQKFQAEQIVIHPSYNDTLATSDLAVIKVAGFKFDEYVQPICIWGPVYDKEDLIGKQATIVGFGQTEDGTYPKILRSAHTMVQNDKTCISYAPKLYPRLLNEFTFCAGLGPNSIINTRNGDSGGGLIFAVQEPDHKLSFVLRGVLSKCGLEDNATLCDPKFYVVFSDVAPHDSWINHHANLRGGLTYLVQDV